MILAHWWSITWLYYFVRFAKWCYSIIHLLAGALLQRRIFLHEILVHWTEKRSSGVRGNRFYFPLPSSFQNNKLVLQCLPKEKMDQWFFFQVPMNLWLKIWGYCSKFDSSLYFSDAHIVPSLTNGSFLSLTPVNWTF